MQQSLASWTESIDSIRGTIGFAFVYSPIFVKTLLSDSAWPGHGQQIIRQHSMPGLSFSHSRVH